MRIENVFINNFRNLNNINIDFHPDINYIVGENNIGKSNLLELLNLIGNSRGFSDSDFHDRNLPIEVIISLRLDEYELGVFGDDFSPEDVNLIRVKIYQEINDARPTLINLDTSEPIYYKALRRINVLKYDTLKNPNSELRFDKNKGASAFLSFLIGKSISKEDTFLESDKVNSLLNVVNSSLGKIKAFKDFNINVSFAQDTTDMLSRLIYLIDENSLPIGDTGNGVQFTVMATLNIFTRILELYKSKSGLFDEFVIEKGEGKKVLSMILAIDEPEVHLHPYMQRSLLSYYKRILTNKDKGFLELLKLCFDIDGLDGQLFIVTHSTDALVDNHRNIVRFYKNSNNKVCTVSGMKMEIKQELEKHLVMHFPEIKEAFYAKCTIIVEGETEYGCLKGFAETIGKPLDEYGICLVNARGEGTTPKLEMLFKHFQIPSIVIFDNDVKEGQTPKDNEFFTDGVCFEMDIVNSLISQNNHDVMKEIVLEYDTKANAHVLDKKFVEKPFAKIKYNIESYQPRKLDEFNKEVPLEYQAIYFAWFYKNKGTIIGRIIGDKLCDESIPQAYKNAIVKAVEISLL